MNTNASSTSAEKIKYTSLNEAMIAAQTKLVSPKKSSTAKINANFAYKYATLDQIIGDENKKILQEHGLRLSETTKIDSNMLILRVRVVHLSQEFEESEWPIAIGKDQDMGKSLTYGRRYCIQCLLNLVAEEDTDGNSQNSFSSNHIPSPTPTKTLPNYAPKSSPIQTTPSDPGEFVISFGKHKGKTLREMGIMEALGYIQYFKDLKAKGEEVNPKAMEVVAAVEKWQSFSQSSDEAQLAKVKERLLKTEEEKLKKIQADRAPTGLWPDDPSF